MKLTPIVSKIMSLLRKEGFEIIRVKGSHLIINKIPSLKRPIIIPNRKRLTNIVVQNLIKQCKEIKIDTSKIEELF
jgi:predicted RNA binding protein YcfA (HicA-like mRNA interferase family)|tara:strand:- start:8096 stop:8323 length:228 start_codon:yes stop_codon:yes gene_type:complete